MIACGSDRPASTSSSSTLSNVAESEPPGRTTGRILREVVAEELGGELRLARAHPVDVAAQRVDLAVVGDHPVRVRELPAREGVRRVAGVHERERRGGALVPQVRVVGRPAAAPSASPCRRPCGPRSSGSRGPARRRARRAAGSRRACARRRRPSSPGAAATKSCRIRGARRGGRRAGVALVDRDVAPGDDASGPPPRPSRPRSCSSAAARAASRGRKHTATPYGPSGGSAAPTSARNSASGSCSVIPAPSPRAGVGALGAAVLEVAERGQRAHDRLVAGDAVEAGDERDATGVVLVGRVVEADSLHSLLIPLLVLSPE